MISIKGYSDTNITKLNKEVVLMESTLKILQDENNELFRTQNLLLNKYFIISLYTCWETFIKKFMRYLLSSYTDVLFNEQFLKKYLETIYDRNYHKNTFLSSIKQESISIDYGILLNSNNLSFDELKKITRRFSFDYQEFVKYINDDVVLLDKIDKLDELGIYPSLTTKKHYKVYDKVEGYIQLFVNARNEISHSYVQLDFYSTMQMKAIIDFFAKIIEIFINFCMYEVVAIALKNIDLLESFEIYNIEKCNSEKDKYSLISLCIPQEYSEDDIKRFKSFIISCGKKKDFLIIEGFRKSKSIENVYTFELKSEFVINRSKSLNIYLYNQEPTTKMKIDFTIT